MEIKRWTERERERERERGQIRADNGNGIIKADFRQFLPGPFRFMGLTVIFSNLFQLHQMD